MVSSRSLTVIVPVAAWSGVSTAYTLPTPWCLRSAKQRTNVPQDLGEAARQAGNPTSYTWWSLNRGLLQHSIGPAKSVPPTSVRRRTREKKTNSRNRSIPVSSQQSITFRKFQVKNIFEHDQVCYRIRPNRIIITVVILQTQQKSLQQKIPKCNATDPGPTAKQR